MKFSIIVPIYNVEKYLDRCVNSLIKQTYKNIEIILVDDESPDKCPQKCDQYEELDSRVHVIHKKNGGLSDARNEGLKAASGEYIIFVDADDYIDIDICERIYTYTNNNIDVIVADGIVEGGDINLGHFVSNSIMTGQEFLLNAYTTNKAPMEAWLNIYNRRFLIDNNLYFKKGILHEDEEFTPRVFLKATSVVLSGEKFYHYIIRDNSITTKKDKRKNANDFFSTCCELEKIYNRLDNNELKIYLLNSLSDKYLNIFQSGKLYRYGKKYLHKDLVKRNAFLKRTKYKANLYCISPVAYYYINNMQKYFKRIGEK